MRRIRNRDCRRCGTPVDGKGRLCSYCKAPFGEDEREIDYGSEAMALDAKRAGLPSEKRVA